MVSTNTLHLDMSQIRSHLFGSNLSTSLQLSRETGIPLYRVRHALKELFRDSSVRRKALHRTCFSYVWGYYLQR